jgi:hypothetical protein
MPKKSKSKAKEHQSPLTTASAEEEASSGKSEEERKKKATGSRQSKKSQKRARKEAEEDDEEQRLTSLLFGSSIPSAPTEFDEKRIRISDSSALSATKKLSASQDEGDFGFEIDRTGEDADEQDESSNIRVVGKGRDVDDSSDGDDEEDGSSDDDNETKETPAWVDQDDNDLSVDIVGSSHRLKKLRKSRGEEAASALTADEFEKRLRKRFEETTQSTAVTQWAKVDAESSKRLAAADPDEEIEMLASSSAPLLATSQHRLPPNILNMMRCPDANLDDPNKAAVQSVHFHPGSDHDTPLMLTAGLDKTLRFFQVGAEKSQKIHGIHCKITSTYLTISYILSSTCSLIDPYSHIFLSFLLLQSPKCRYIPLLSWVTVEMLS